MKRNRIRTILTGVCGVMVWLLACISIPDGYGLQAYAESGEPVVEAVEPAAETGADPGRSVLISQTYLYDNDSETYQTYGTGTIRGIRLGKEQAGKYPALAAALDKFSTDQLETLTDQFWEYSGYSRSAHNDGGWEFEAFIETDIKLRRFDDQVLSFVVDYSDYSGGVHGYYSYNGFNYNAQTGEEIQLSDVIADAAGLRSVVVQKLHETYGDYLEPDLDGILSGYSLDGGSPGYNWVLEHDGISIMFNPYAIGPYAAGAQHVHIGFLEYPNLFTGTYHAQEGAYAFQIHGWLDEQIDPDGDGVYEDFAITQEYEEYDGDMRYAGRISIGVKLGQGSCSLDDVYYYECQPLFMHTAEGRNFLYAELGMENDYHMIEVFDLNNPSPFWVGTIDAGFAGRWNEELELYSREIPADPTALTLVTRMQMLSTYDGRRAYSVNKDGMAMTADHYYFADEESPVKLRTIRPLPVTFLKVSGPNDPGTESATGFVPAGQELTIWRTNDTDTIDLKMGENGIVRVKYDSVGWPRTIAGEEESTFFEQLYYAG